MIPDPTHEQATHDGDPPEAMPTLARTAGAAYC